MRRLLPALLTLTLFGPALAQQPPAGWGRDLDVEKRYDTVEYVVSPPPAAAPSLGGTVGAVAAAQGASNWHEDLLVMRSGPRGDARVIYAFTEPEDGGPRLRRVVFDLRADTIVGFVGVGAGLDVAPRALYAEGHVRLVIEAPEGEGVLECEQAWLDLAHERAFLFQAEARGRLERGPAGLVGISPVLRARWLRLHDPAHLVGEQAEVTACDFGVPHFALRARRIELTRPVDEEPAPRLLAGFLDRRGGADGSDAVSHELSLPRDVRLRDVRLFVLGHELPLLPFLHWNTAWPLPTVRAGRSSRFGTFLHGAVRLDLAQVELGPVGQVQLDGQTSVDYFERRGSGGEVGVDWRRRAAGNKGEGFFRAHYQRDRAREDRVGTPITTPDRFWLRGLWREQLPGGVRLDAEVSRLSDRGFLLEYHRDVAKTEKEQETYVNGRWSVDDFAAQLLARWRLNDFQTQVERLPEGKLDWIETPLWTHPWLGGVYLDAQGRAGELRLRPDDALALPSERLERADGRLSLDYRVSLGPIQARGFGAVRESYWTRRAGADEDVDRFLGEAGWNVATTFWRDWATPWTVLRHEVVPEVGMFHRFHVTRDPSELILLDPEVEALYPTDYLFLRLRTRFLADVAGVRQKLLDFAIETRYYPRDRGLDVARHWGSVFYDLRLRFTDWLSARARAEQDVNGGGLVTLDVAATLRPWPGLEATAAYRERPGVARAFSWGISWQLTPAWAVAFEQQYDFLTDDFLYHRGRLIRSFHRFALELRISHDPQQDDTSVSVGVSLAPLFSSSQDPFARDRIRGLYE